MKKKTGIYSEAETYIKSLVIDSEYKISASNNREQVADLESILDMVELTRSEKNASWKSDIFIGLLLSHLLTDEATWAAQDFQSRDFVEVYLEGTDPNDKNKAHAAKVLINQMLNMRDLYHFQKKMRARIINWLFGQVYVLCWWDYKEIKRTISRDPISTVHTDYDEDGNLVQNQIQIPQKPEETTEVVVDRMNYEVFDSRNVFTDYGYTYSVQQKPWVTLRSEKTYNQLFADQEDFGYFNLDVLKDKLFGGGKRRKVNNLGETQTARESYNKAGGAYGTKSQFFQVNETLLDVLDRYGTMWAIVEERDDDEGFPTKIRPGYLENGELDDKAELVESIVTFAGIGEDYTMIGFRPTWAID